MASLTLCMIVRDEEERLPRSLASAASVVDEIVVVDTGSTDGTIEVARRHGALVIPHDFTQVDFAAARNRGLDAAHGDAVLVLDADEELDPAGLPLVRQLVDAGGDVGWILTRRNLPFGGASPTWVDYVVRLFPNRPGYRFRARVHETVDGSILDGGGRLCRCGITLHHHLQGEDVLRAKWRWYVDLLRTELTDRPDDADRWVFLMADYVKLRRFGPAADAAERVAELRPEDFTAQFHAALCAFLDAGAGAGDGAGRGTGEGEVMPARVREHLAAALAIRPDDPEARLLAHALEVPEAGGNGCGSPRIVTV